MFPKFFAGVHAEIITTEYSYDNRRNLHDKRPVWQNTATVGEATYCRFSDIKSVVETAEVLYVIVDAGIVTKITVRDEATKDLIKRFMNSRYEDNSILIEAISDMKETMHHMATLETKFRKRKRGTE